MLSSVVIVSSFSEQVICVTGMLVGLRKVRREQDMCVRVTKAPDKYFRVQKIIKVKHAFSKTMLTEIK